VLGGFGKPPVKIVGAAVTITREDIERLVEWYRLMLRSASPEDEDVALCERLTAAIAAGN
jgi:hypothetical protein